ncbi:hypothetical protein ACFL3Q_12395 [Planctomycetota bacterium]
MDRRPNEVAVRNLLRHKLGATYGGLNTALAPHIIENGASPEMDGFVMRTKGAEAAKGWSKLTTQQFTDGAASPSAISVLKIDQYFKRDGSSYLIACTTKRIYSFNEGDSIWYPITPGLPVPTLVDASSPAAAKVVNVTTTDGYYKGDRIIIDEGNAQEEIHWVDSITNPGASGELNTRVNLTYTHAVGVAVRRYSACSFVDADSNVTIGQQVTDDVTLSDGLETDCARSLTDNVDLADNVSKSLTGEFAKSLWDSMDVLSGSGRERTLADQNLSDTAYLSDSAAVELKLANAQKLLYAAYTDQFTVGEEVIIGLGTARQEYAIIEAIEDDVSLRMVNGMQYAHTASDADAIYRVAELSFPATATFVDTENADNYWYYTDGTNAIQRWDALGTPSFTENLPGLSLAFDGSDVFVEGHAAAITADIKAKFVRSFEGFLVIGHTTEEGTTIPQRVRWPRYGNSESWVNAADGTGQAGYFTFAGADFIMRLQQLKRELMIYRERTVEGMSYLGPPNIFGYRRVETGLGLISQEALTDLGDMHIILGPDDAYAIDGMSAPPVGGNVKATMFDEMNPAFKDYCQVFYMEEESEALFVFPTGSSRKGTKAYIWSTLFKKWVGTRPMSAVGFGYYERQATTTWDTIQGTWDEQDRIWDSRQFLEAAPLNMMGDDQGYVYIIDEDPDQDGTGWTRTYKTKVTDLGDSTISNRVLELRLGMRREGSGNVTVYLGKLESEGDEPVWSDPVTVSLEGGSNGYAYFDEAAKLFQVRVEATTLFNLREVEFGHVPLEDIG